MMTRRDLLKGAAGGVASLLFAPKLLTSLIDLAPAPVVEAAPMTLTVFAECMAAAAQEMAIEWNTRVLNDMLLAAA